MKRMAHDFLPLGAALRVKPRDPEGSIRIVSAALAAMGMVARASLRWQVIHRFEIKSSITTRSRHLSLVALLQWT